MGTRMMPSSADPRIVSGRGYAVRRPWRWLAGVFLLAMACGSEAPIDLAPAATSGGASPVAAVPGKLTQLPATMLEGYVVHATKLDTSTISVDALDPSALAAVLTGAGFEAGAERRFTTRGKGVTEVVTRVLLFASADGPVAYLAWLKTHAPDVLGSQTELADPPGVTGAIAFTHAPCGSCAKDTFQYFAAWAHGSYALTITVGGPEAGLKTAAPIARALDERVAKDG